MNGASGGEARDCIRFIVLFHPRCGSSWLRSMLAANANIRMGPELLNKRTSVESQQAFVEDYFTAPQAEPIQAVGFKAAPGQIIDKPGLVEQLTRLDVRVVEITRRDLLKTSISQIRRAELAERSRAETGKAVQNLVEGLEPPPPSTIPPRRLLTQLRRDDTVRNDVRFLAAAIPTPRLILTYEDLFADRHAQLDRLADFLDVEIAERDEFRPRKNTPDDLAEAVANLDEVRAALLESDYAALAGF